MPTTLINGVRLYWELSGEGGDPVVLVHGSWGDHRNWASVVPGLACSFLVLTYDRRGHSRSERPPGQGSIREDVADLAALLEHIGLTPAHIVGSSFGAAIVLRLATERPDLFRSMVIHEPPLFDLLADEPEVQPELATARHRIAAAAALLAAGDMAGGARQFVDTIAMGPGTWAKLPPEVRDTFVANAPTWLDELHDPEALTIDLDGLRDFSARAMLSVGEQSRPFFRQIARQIAAASPRMETRTYVGAGHVPHMSHPDEYLREVTSFMQGRYGARITAREEARRV